MNQYQNMSKNIQTQVAKKYNNVKTFALKEMKKHVTKKRKKQITAWFENGGKTTIFFGILLLIVIILLSQFISFKKPQNINQQKTNQSTNTNDSIPLYQAEYAGYMLDTSDTNFKVTILDHTDTIKRIEIANDSVKMTITSTKIPDTQSPIQTGFNPQNSQITTPKDQNRIYEVKGKKILFVPQTIDGKITFSLVNMVKTGDKETYSSSFNLFEENGKEYKYTDEITIQNLHKDITQKDTDSLDKVISILQNTQSVTAKEFFVDTASTDDIKKLVDSKSYAQSSALKYKIPLFDRYNLKDSPDITQLNVTKDDSASIEILKKDAQIPDSAKNLKQIGTTNMYRSSSLSFIQDKILSILIYSNKGDYRTVNLFPNNTQNILLARYKIKLNQSVDDIKGKIKELDTMIASISDNSSKELPKCDKLRGQEMPFGSPLCGKQLEYTKINREFNLDHKALDIVPNEEYVKQNETFKKTKKEVFYSPCDGTKSVGQDKVTKANIITIKCKNDAFVIQFWHDSESFWNFDGQVKAGDAIGVMGDTGSADGRHIHYVIEKNGERVDPLELIKS